LSHHRNTQLPRQCRQCYNFHLQSGYYPLDLMYPQHEDRLQWIATHVDQFPRFLHCSLLQVFHQWYNFHLLSDYYLPDLLCPQHADRLQWIATQVDLSVCLKILLFANLSESHLVLQFSFLRFWVDFGFLPVLPFQLAASDCYYLTHLFELWLIPVLHPHLSGLCLCYGLLLPPPASGFFVDFFSTAPFL